MQLHKARKGKDIRRLDIPVNETVYGGLTKTEVVEAAQKEVQLAEQDLKMERTKDRKNALEGYVYDIRDKVHFNVMIIYYFSKFDKQRSKSNGITYFYQISNVYGKFATETEKETISRNLQETEDWLYEDGDDESESVYSAKLEDLKKVTLTCNYFVYE